MSYETHRIYKYMDEPLRYLGLTLDEMLAVLTGITGSMWFMGDLILQAVSALGGFFLLMVLKRLKKQKFGQNFKGVLYWNGLPFYRNSRAPKFNHRIYLK